MRVVAVAVDVQGAEVARPWVECAGATFPALLDDADALFGRFGLTLVPVALAVGEDGKLVEPPSVVDVRDDATAGALRRWARGEVEVPGLSRAVPPGANAANRALAGAYVRLAALALKAGRRRDAADVLRRAREHDPDNWLVRKQLWAVEHPERFYDGPIDADWQRAQLAAEG
jgi:hypothetical protein